MMESKTEFPVTGVRICIDSQENGLSGFLCGIALENCLEFAGEDELVHSIDRAYDLIGRPQPTVVRKSFGSGKPDYDSYVASPPQYHSSDEIRALRGKVRTVDIVMTGRNHAEWQGICKSEDGNILFRFETMLELMRKL